MALMICPECRKKISDKANVCVHCGFPLDKYNDTQKEGKNVLPTHVEEVLPTPSKSPNEAKPKKKLSKKKIATIVCCGVIAVILSTFLFQYLTAQSAINSFERGDYVSAKESSDRVFLSSLIDPHEDKIDAMYRIAYDYNRWKKRSSSNDDHSLLLSKGMALSVLEECVSNSTVVEKNDCENLMYQYAKEIGIWLNSQGVDIEAELIDRFKEKSISDYYPLFVDVREESGILDIIKKVARFAESGGVFCVECGKSADCYITNPISGNVEAYCQSHYQEICDIIKKMESDVNSSK